MKQALEQKFSIPDILQLFVILH